MKENHGALQKQNAMTPVTLSGLYAYMYCMMMSAALTDLPMLGGALYLCSRVAVIGMRVMGAPSRVKLTGAMKAAAVALSAVMLLIALALVVFFPITLADARVWILFGAILSMTVRDLCVQRLIRLSVTRGMPEKNFLLFFIPLHLMPVAVVAALLFYSLSSVAALQLLGGFAVLCVLQVYGQLKDREEQRVRLVPIPTNRYEELVEKMHGVNAFRTYSRLSTLVLIAMEITMVLMYTFLAVTGEQLLTCMALSLGCTLAAREAAEFFLRRMERKHRDDPTAMLLIGLFLWIYALMLFMRYLQGANTQVNAYFCLGMCSCGVTLCMTVLARLERTMGQVAQFAAEGETDGFRQVRGTADELAVLCGQVVALLGLTILSFAFGREMPRDVSTLAQGFQPLLLIPALLLVAGAVVSTLHFPLDQRYMAKLEHFLRLRKEGESNPALQKQLENVVIKPHRQPLTVNLLKLILRPFFRHMLIGTENIHPDPNNPVVFLCNHGELYGPIVAMLNIPVPLRPWTISEITVNKDEVAAYVYKYTISRQKWLPECLKWPVARLIGPLSVWCMNCVEAIPVYRNKPRDLINTFRLSVEAMQAGDNLLIFPENPNAVAEGHGYERHGLGELFSGFAMLAPIYYNRTGKRCRFVPVYAHPNTRTMTFASEIVYDPDNDPTEERDRIVAALQNTMAEIYEREESAWQKKKKAARRKPPRER